MPQPTPYDRQNSFSLHSAQNPSSPQRGTDLDIEFNAVKVSLDETQGNLKRIQSDDGRLAPGSVGRDQLDSSITIGFKSPLPWTTDTLYTVDVSTVFNEAKFYTALETHTSGAVFDASKWRLVADLSVAAALPDGGVTEAKIADAAVTSAKIATNAVVNSKIGASAVTTAKIADAAVTLVKMAAAVPAQLRDLILPAGLGPLPWSGASLPDGWDWADGGVLLSDTAFPALRQRYIDDSFPHGQDGSGNPKKPDGKGRSIFGKDNMGGSAAGRLTSAGSGVDGTTLGATGGAQSVVLVQANLPNVTFATAVAAGQGSHRHSYSVGQSAANGFETGPNPHLGSNAGTNTGFATLPAMTGTTPSGGSDTAHNNVPPALVCNLIIKAH
ncbi:hypothetical protein [Afipia sp. Root123D2]|uniref:hypothetical protein n=1 Tax=Afipia sp. Root123D2 TaxID=1736436 RepID=UPI0012E7B5A5|nr:hypothetical protein [Afipia sp. Root123D2]